MDILARITQLREARGWSEYRLAKEADIPQSTVSNLYRRGNSPTVSTLEAICNAFGITLAQFFAGTYAQESLTEEQCGLLECWARLSAAQKELAMAYMLGLSNQPQEIG